MKKLFVLFLISSFCVFSYAQKVSLISGDYSALKGQKSVNIKYDYKNVGVGKYKDEQDYITNKVADYNKKEPGRGDKWKEAWFNDRPTRFEPKFEELLNKYLEKAGMTVSQNNKDAEYTMVVRVLFIEPGFNIYVTRKPAMINTEIDLVKSADPGKVLGTIEAKNMPGATFGGYDYDTGIRIAESFAKCGKDFGAFLSKKVLK
jgi:hypothetical protein